MTTKKTPTTPKAKPAAELGRADPAAASAAVLLPAEPAPPAVLLLDAKAFAVSAEPAAVVGLAAATDGAVTAPAADAQYAGPMGVIQGLQDLFEALNEGGDIRPKWAEVLTSASLEVGRLASLNGDLESRASQLEQAAADVQSKVIPPESAGLVIAGVSIDPGAGDDSTVLQIRDPALALIDVLAERQRQVEKGYGADADAEHTNHQLAKASACYLSHAAGFAPARATRDWPWPKPMRVSETRREMLVKGAALALAELERYDLANAAEATQ